jgi:predicted nucleic acid-binding protein
MSAKQFVDTNILVYAHDRSTGAKHRRAQELIESLWNSGDGVVSTQVLQELCVNLRQKIRQPLPVGEVRQVIRDYATWDVVTNTAESVLRALDVAERYRTSFRVAMILQAADTAGVAVLYSDDLARGQKYGFVQVVNPLL